MVTYELGGIRIEAETSPDLFSPKGLDKGTALLLEQLIVSKYHSALDWGCGWGAMTLWLAAHEPAAEVIGLDSDWGAVKVARKNVARNGLSNCAIELSHGYGELDPRLTFDLIISNPPTHRGREVVEEMIQQSQTKLRASGKLVIVVESRLKPWVQRAMQATYGNANVLSRTNKHVVLESKKSVL